MDTFKSKKNIKISQEKVKKYLEYLWDSFLISSSYRYVVQISKKMNQEYKRYYIQSAFAILDREKLIQESWPLLKIDDSFKKIIIERDVAKLYYSEEGILVMGIMDFLLSDNILDL